MIMVVSPRTPVLPREFRRMAKELVGTIPTVSA